MTGGSGFRDRDRRIFSGSRLIGPEFFMLNAQDWPTRTGLSGGAAPRVSFGRFATFDNQTLHWRSMHTGPGQYVWSEMDKVVAAIPAACRIVYCMYGTPRWLAGDAVAGPYGGIGEGAPPTDIAQASAFMTALMTRYGAKIEAVQIWNEPDFLPSGGSGFWRGSRAQLVALISAVAAAARAVRPQTVILSPGCTLMINPDSGADQWLNAGGADHIDALSLHPYRATPTGRYAGDGDIASTPQALRLAARVFPRGRAPWITEWGVGSASHPMTLQFRALSAAGRRRYIAAMFLAAAAHGAECFAPWGHGNWSGLSGDWINDTDGVIAGWNDAYSALVGKTLAAVDERADGALMATFSNGETWSALAPDQTSPSPSD